MLEDTNLIAIAPFVNVDDVVVVAGVSWLGAN